MSDRWHPLVSKELRDFDLCARRLGIGPEADPRPAQSVSDRLELTRVDLEGGAPAKRQV